MAYRTLRDAVDDLEAHGHLLRIKEPVEAHLEVAEIHRRVFQAGGPALYFSNVAGCRFPMVSNLFGTIERARFLFRQTLPAVRKLVELKVDPTNLLRRPLRYLTAPWAACSMLPKNVSTGPVLAHETTIDQLPQLKSWPNDGGAFITLPQVFTEDPDRPGLGQSNLGMYRVQLSGGQYEPNREIGLHYQIHRHIGVHHERAIRRGVPLRVNIFVGGPPAMTLSAVMPLPEGLSELRFAGALGGRRIRMIRRDGPSIYADADFCITGTIDPEKQLPEGPFGDHLGYYSLAHDFPVLRVEHVYHRADAIWPFTVVGRPPQEDTMFGELIHELTGPAIPTVLAGVHAVHAVDATGVHPLLLAIGSERYVPYAPVTRPQELLTQANAILGQGQLSLAKYLLIVSREDAPDLNIHNVPAFLTHVLERIDWNRDLHFQTCTTIDTLDYSGSGFNEGSKVIIAAVGPARRKLATQLPKLHLPLGVTSPRLCHPGIVALQANVANDQNGQLLGTLCEALKSQTDALVEVPLLVLTDDSEFAARTLNNFLWVTFTRSNPAHDIHGVDSWIEHKHWGCRGSLIIDARQKPHHAPGLFEDPQVTRRVDALAAPGGPLHGII